MSVNTYELYHGAAINRIIDFGKDFRIMKFPSDTNSS